MNKLLIIIVFVTACSNPQNIEGLWVGDNDRSYLEFSKDSVIVQPSLFGNPAHYYFDEDKITFN